MAHHEPAACERVPYTAYFSNGTWSWQVRCPVCENAQRQNLSTDGRGEMLCDGSKIEQAKLAPTLAESP